MAHQDLDTRSRLMMTMMVLQLLDANAAVDHVDKALNTPLLLSAMRADDAAVSVLLNRSANVAHCNDQGNTALHKLASCGARHGEDRAVATAVTLIARGCPVQQLNKQRESCLMKACRQGSEPLVRVLLEHMPRDGNQVSLDGHNTRGIIATAQLMECDRSLLMMNRYCTNTHRRYLLA